MKRLLLMLLLMWSWLCLISANTYFPMGLKWVSYVVTCDGVLKQRVLRLNDKVEIDGMEYSKIGNILVRSEDRKVIILYEGEEYILYNFLLEEGDQIPVALFDNTDENEQIMMATVSPLIQLRC